MGAAFWKDDDAMNTEHDAGTVGQQIPTPPKRPRKPAAINTTGILTTMAGLCVMLACGHSKAAELVASGEIASVRLGRKRCPVVRSVHEYVAKLEAQAAAERKAQPQAEAPTTPKRRRGRPPKARPAAEA
jgi:hypothetical protein